MFIITSAFGETNEKKTKKTKNNIVSQTSWCSPQLNKTLSFEEYVTDLFMFLSKVFQFCIVLYHLLLGSHIAAIYSLSFD